MRVLLKAPSITDEDLSAYLADAFRNQSLESARGWETDNLLLFRGTRVPEDFPGTRVTSWTDSPIDARTFGPHVRNRNVHEILAIVKWEEDNGWIWHEYITREPS